MDGVGGDTVGQGGGVFLRRRGRYLHCIGGLCGAGAAPRFALLLRCWLLLYRSYDSLTAASWSLWSLFPSVRDAFGRRCGASQVKVVACAILNPTTSSHLRTPR